MTETILLFLLASLTILFLISLIAVTLARIVNLIIYRRELVKQKLKELEQLKEKEKND